MSSKLTSFRLIFLVVAILFCSASSKTDQEQNNTGFSAQTGSSDSPFHLEASVTKDQNFDKIIVDGIAIGVGYFLMAFILFNILGSYAHCLNSDSIVNFRL
jgi:hypothetical protein